jgi:hypothetical protein
MSLGEWREVESSPCTGKCSAPSLLLAWEHLRRSLPRHSIPANRLPGPSVGVFQAWRNLSVRCGRNQPWGGNRQPPDGRSRAQVKERAGRITPFSSSAMSSDRLFLDRVARQHCPSPLHRHEQINMRSSNVPGKGDISTLPARGHFYFALTPLGDSLWRQSDNVPFEQSRNVPLTPSRCEDAGRTTTDDPSRS